MKRIRIGKDINVQWVLHAPAGVVLTSENLSIELKDPKGRQAEVENFTLEAQQDKYAVYFALRGTAFSQLGNYTFTAWLNKGEQGQSVVDAVNAFALVGSTQAEDNLHNCGCGCLNLATVDLQGDISFVGRPGYSPSASVTQTSSGAIISVTDKNGTTMAEVSNGTQGNPGVSPAVTIETIQGGHQVTITDATHPQGQSFDVMDGQNGEDGQPGFSPIATVSKSGKVATISITDKNGTTTTTISDGEDGVNGQDGSDGFSPIASVSKSGDTATITITDKNGTTTATVKDGSDASITIDPTPTQNSTNAVSSGGVYNAIASIPTPTPEIFWATYGTTTATEIQTAIDAGKMPMVRYTSNNSEGIYIYLHKFADRHYFLCWQDNTKRQIKVNGSSWSLSSTALQGTNYKISSTSSTTPTDTYYYSALATKNLVDAVDGKIEGPWTKLVDTILEEDTTNTGFSVNLNKDCSKLKIIAVFPANASLSSNKPCYIGLMGRGGSTTLICGNSPLRSTPAKVIAEYTYESGLGWQGFLSQSANATNEDGNNAYSVVNTNLRGANVGAVYSVRIYGNNIPLIAGTKIQIWGK